MFSVIDEEGQIQTCIIHPFSDPSLEVGFIRTAIYFLKQQISHVLHGQTGATGASLEAIRISSGFWTVRHLNIILDLLDAMPTKHLAAQVRRGTVRRKFEEVLLAPEISGIDLISVEASWRWKDYTAMNYPENTNVALAFEAILSIRNYQAAREFAKGYVSENTHNTHD